MIITDTVACRSIGASMKDRLGPARPIVLKVAKSTKMKGVAVVLLVVGILLMVVIGPIALSIKGCQPHLLTVEECLQEGFVDSEHYCRNEVKININETCLPDFGECSTEHDYRCVQRAPAQLRTHTSGPVALSVDSCACACVRVHIVRTSASTCVPTSCSGPTRLSARVSPVCSGPTRLPSHVSRIQPGLARVAFPPLAH